MQRIKHFLILFGLLLVQPTFSQTADITADPMVGNAPLNITVSWTAADVNSCQRNNTSVPLVGSESVTGLLVDTTFTIVCEAGDTWAQISWTAPTTRTDGSPLTNLAGFRIYYRLMGQSSDTIINLPDPGLTTYRVEPLSEGIWVFAMTAYDANQLESVHTNSINKSLALTTVEDSVTIVVNEFSPTFSTYEPQVYNVVKRTNGFVLVYVGTVPLNTPCDIDQTVNGYYAVQVSEVTWAGTVRPIVVVGRCSEQ